MAGRNLWEIEQVTGGFRIRVLATGTAEQQPWTFVDCTAVKQIHGVIKTGFGTRDATNLRKNPVREDDTISLIISFHDENNTSPIDYDIQYVNNQPGWTPDLAGLNQAISDVTSWCGGVANLISVITGNVETPSTVQDTTPAAAGTTNAGVKGFSILFEGTGGTLNGVPVVSGYVSSKDASLGNTLSSESYVVPNVADPNFANSPRVVITYVT